MGLFRRRTPTDQLIDGYKKFRRTTFRRLKSEYRRVAMHGQHPKVLLIGCSDSRVSPTTIFNAHPGELFVARNIANIVPPYDPDARPRSIGAAVEYAIKVLNVTDIVVKGHARCGGVAALLDRARHLPPTDYLKPWVDVAGPASMFFPPDFDELDADQQRQIGERANVQNSLHNLSGFPWVLERREEGSLRLHGWHFDILTGKLSRLDDESGEWRDV